MAAMSNDSHTVSPELASALGRFLSDSKARDVVVLDVDKHCSWARLLVIGTYNSVGHLKGLVQDLDAWSSEHFPEAPRHMKKNQVNDWMLVDWDDIVIHLFSESARSYYELEKIWFSAPVIYRSPAT